MNGNADELRKELWMWRAVILIALLMLTIVTVVTFYIERDQRTYDVRVRAESWTTIQNNQQRILGKLDKNYDAILRNDEHLLKCSGCHSHAKVVK
jgi:hypothetical protein